MAPFAFRTICAAIVQHSNKTSLIWSKLGHPRDICQLFCSLVITLHSGTYFHSSFDIHYIGKKGVICIIPGHLLENDKKKTPMFLFFFHLTNFKTVPTYTSIRKSRVRIQQSTAKYYILNNSSQDNKRYISDIGLEFINERTVSQSQCPRSEITWQPFCMFKPGV